MSTLFGEMSTSKTQFNAYICINSSVNCICMGENNYCFLIMNNIL